MRIVDRHLAFGACVVLLMGVSLPGCGDEVTAENALVSALIGANVTVRDTTVQATGSSTFKQPLPMDAAQNLLGRFGNYTAYTVIQFYSSLFPHRDTILVVSARLRLRAVSWFGDSSAAFGFNVHRITRSWSQTTLRWDSVLTGFYESSPTGVPYAGTVESDTQVVSIDLDTAMVRVWLRPQTDTSYGIILVPTPATNVVRGFQAFGYDSASVEVIAVNTSQTVRDTAVYRSGQDTFVGNLDNLNSTPDTLIYLQSGVVYRSTVKFDVSFIPEGAIVNSAELLLDRHSPTTKLTKFSHPRDSLTAHVLLSATDNNIFESRNWIGAIKEGTAHTFKVDVRHAAQLWVNGSNNGLLLRTTSLSEFNSFDLYTFYNERASDSALRPRVRIVYSIIQNR